MTSSGEMPLNMSDSIPFQDPGFALTDNHDTHGASPELVTFADMELVDNAQMKAIKAACQMSPQDCRQNHKNKRYVGGLGEAGYPLAPHEMYVTAPGSDVQLVRSGNDEMPQVRDLDAYFTSPGTCSININTPKQNTHKKKETTTTTKERNTPRSSW